MRITFLGRTKNYIYFQKLKKKLNPETKSEIQSHVKNHLLSLQNDKMYKT